MRRLPDEDLFKDSTMTFGEHLDELRSALFKSLLALIVGSCVGLYFADVVVQAIQVPLKAALEEFFLKRAVKDFLVCAAEREQRGEKVDPRLQDPVYVEQLINQEQLLFEEKFVDPAELVDALREKYPGAVDDTKIPKRDSTQPPKKSDLLRILLWHTVQDDFRIRVVGLSPQEAFVIWIKAGIVTGFVLASPLIFYFIWQFVAAGLYPNEKSYVHIFLPFSLGLFLVGVAVTVFFVFPAMLEFFFSFYERIGTEPDQRLSEWLSLVLILPLGFGLSFQLPLVMLFLQRINLLSTETYLKQWRMAVLVIAIASMIITPTGDPYTMLLLIGPLTLLYFGGIALCKWLPRRS